MATLMIVATKLNELNRLKLMKKYKIGAFPNMTMMMFNQISDLDVRQHKLNVDYKAFGCKNQEKNNQTQMFNKNNINNTFSKYFDVLLIEKNQHDDNDATNSMMKFNVLMFVNEENLLMDINNDDDDLLKYTANTTAIDDSVLMQITVLSQPTKVNMNIPLLKIGSILEFVGRCLNKGGAVGSVTNDNNIYLMKQTMMAILHIVLNDNDMMIKIIQNSNNKKLTNNCKIEINTENINFSYYCDEYYEIIFNVSVFLSQKFDDIMQINGSMVKMIEEKNKLQSHIKSFIVTDENDNIDDDDDDDKIQIIMITKSSTSSQSNTNKSEYAFEKTLNNDKFYVACNIDKKKISVKSMMQTMMESTSKLFLSSHFFSFFMQLYPMMINNSFIHNNRIDADDDEDDDAGYMMISVEMQLKCQKSLQSYKESDQQSGIVSNNSCNNIKIVNIINSTGGGGRRDNADDDDDDEIIMVKEATAVHMPHADNDRMNISELLFSHINDKNETLIDNTVNITCDFNYLNYNINYNKINDQIHKDNEKFSVKNTYCYNNKMMMMESANHTDDIDDIEKKTTTEKKDGNEIASATIIKYKPMTQIDKLIECQRRESALIKQYEANGGRRLRLCGGGGDSLSGGGTSGWGSPPSNTTTSNNPNAGQWGASAQQTPQQPWNQAAQQAGGGVGGPASSQQQSQQVQQQQNAAVGQPQQGGAQGPKPLTPSGGWNQPPNPNQAQQQQQQQQPPQVPGIPTGVVGGGTSTVAAKNQLEQINSMREALFSQDGWGCQNVNQDTNWDVPGSPEPGPRDPASGTGATQWKSHNINNGTELWEANLRNGGQPPPQPVQKTPWNHTPTSNIGGTWGEDEDENSENTNVWAANQNTQQAPSWNQGGGNTSGAASNNNAMWPAAAQGKR